MTTQAPSAPAPAPAPSPSVSAPKPSGSSFGFHYEGPIEKRQTPGCVLCIAALGMAPPHTCMPGCAVCAAGRTKVCTSHQGMKVALDEASVPAEMKPIFDAARGVVESSLESAPGSSNVKIKVFGQVGMPDAPPRTMTVEVTLLKG